VTRADAEEHELPAAELRYLREIDHGGSRHIIVNGGKEGPVAVEEVAAGRTVVREKCRVLVEFKDKNSDRKESLKSPLDAEVELMHDYGLV
jgi:hypothetical protein